MTLDNLFWIGVYPLLTALMIEFINDTFGQFFLDK